MQRTIPIAGLSWAPKVSNLGEKGTLSRCCQGRHIQLPESRILSKFTSPDGSVRRPVETAPAFVRFGDYDGGLGVPDECGAK